VTVLLELIIYIVKGFLEEAHHCKKKRYALSLVVYNPKNLSWIRVR